MSEEEIPDNAKTMSDFIPSDNGDFSGMMLVSGCISAIFLALVAALVIILMRGIG